MISIFLNSIRNSCVVNVCYNYAVDISTYLLESHRTVGERICEVVETLVNFDVFQQQLLKAFLLTLICNVLLIYVCWRWYGQRICDRFMKPATSTTIEELKASVSRLKLPKEHSPRI